MKSVLPGMSLLLCLCAAAGCTPQQPEPSVLQGRWLLTADEPILGPTTLTFDAEGEVTRIVIQAADGIQLIRNNPASETVLQGDQVEIYVNAPLLGTLAFEGTLNEQGTAIEGQLTMNVNLVVATVVIDNGNAALVKVQ